MSDDPAYGNHTRRRAGVVFERNPGPHARAPRHSADDTPTLCLDLAQLMAEAENPTQPLPLAGTFDDADSEAEKAAASRAFQRHAPLDLMTLQRVLDGLRRRL